MGGEEATFHTQLRGDKAERVWLGAGRRLQNVPEKASPG